MDPARWLDPASGTQWVVTNGLYVCVGLYVIGIGYSVALIYGLVSSVLGLHNILFFIVIAISTCAINMSQKTAIPHLGSFELDERKRSICSIKCWK